MLTLTITGKTLKELRLNLAEAVASLGVDVQTWDTTDTNKDAHTWNIPTANGEVKEPAKRGRKPKQPVELGTAVEDQEEKSVIDTKQVAQEVSEDRELTVEDCKNAMRALIADKGIPTASAVLEPFNVKAARFLEPHQFASFVKAANEARAS